MAINSIGGSALLGQSILNIKNQLNTLQGQLASGETGTSYSAMAPAGRLAFAAPSQLANIAGYQNAITNGGTTINVANTALQNLSDTANQIQQAAANDNQTLNSNGQSTAQTSAVSELQSMLSTLNTQS